LERRFTKAKAKRLRKDAVMRSDLKVNSLFMA
jgi:hypothetical protein